MRAWHVIFLISGFFDSLFLADSGGEEQDDWLLGLAKAPTSLDSRVQTLSFCKTKACTIETSLLNLSACSRDRFQPPLGKAWDDSSRESRTVVRTVPRARPVVGVARYLISGFFDSLFLAEWRRRASDWLLRGPYYLLLAW